MNPVTWRRAMMITLGTCLLLRILHLAAVVESPFLYHLGPDEDYYLRFGSWLAGVTPGDPTEFAFMDPAYGYFIGGVFELFGYSKAAVLGLQALLDTSTCLLIALAGRELDKPRAGLAGAALYALTATAVMYTATFLKAAWVANALMLWVLFGLVLLRQRKAWPWLLFGLYCGYCVALRGNLLMLMPAAMVLLPWLYTGAKPAGRQPTILLRTVLLAAGMVVPLLALGLRNVELSQKFSPLPNNGGTVLHQVYNEDNPRAESWYPPFAAYSNPTDIVRGYAREARRRTGRDLSAGEVDAYWRREALQYIRANPSTVAVTVARKTLEFAAHTEVANNRSLIDERLFSPVLRALPSPFGWLFSLGIAGLVLLTWQDRRGWIIVAPFAVVVATFAVFFAESRFRFHAVPLLALGSGLFVDQLITWIRTSRRSAVAAAIGAMLSLGAISAWATRQVPTPSISWDAIAWGYFKMGDLISAERTLETPHPGMEITDKWEEALGLLNWSQGNFEAAAEHYRNAVELNPASHVAHFNLALSLHRTGDLPGARRHANIAVNLVALPEYVQFQQLISSN